MQVIIAGASQEDFIGYIPHDDGVGLCKRRNSADKKGEKGDQVFHQKKLWLVSKVETRRLKVKQVYHKIVQVYKIEYNLKIAMNTHLFSLSAPIYA